MAPAAPPELPVELVEEILLRLPPDEPACLLRASLVCKAWASVVSHPSFRRRIHEHHRHRAPPVLGFLHGSRDERVPDFVCTTASAFSLAAPDRRLWRALDCRHGRAVFFSMGNDTKELLLWEPFTGAQQRLPVPAAFESGSSTWTIYPTAAVFCAADGCDHRGCHGGPFRVAFVFTVERNTEDEEYVTSASVYSSETGNWGELTSLPLDFIMDFPDFSCVLVGKSLLYFMSRGVALIEYDLARNALTVIHLPYCDSMYEDRFSLMLADDGGLRLIQHLNTDLNLWSRKASNRTDGQWVLRRVIELDYVLPGPALVDADSSLFVLGFAEGASVIFVDTAVGLFMIELLSKRKRARKVSRKHGFRLLVPIVGFYTPVSRNEHHVLPLSNASAEERGEEEKTVDQTQQLFDHGSIAINEGTSSTLSNVSAMSSVLGDRVPPLGDIAPESTYMDAALLYEAQEVTDPLGDVPKRFDE